MIAEINPDLFENYLPKIVKLIDEQLNSEIVDKQLRT